MAIKDIFLPLTSFPVSTEARTIETAVALADSLKAAVSAIAVAMDIQSPVGLYADPLNVSGILKADSEKSAANARDLLSLFETMAIKRGIKHDHSLVRCKPHDVPVRFTDEARFRDVTVLPLRDGDGAGQEIAERLIFESGRPVLILPDNRAVPVPPQNIAIAWDFSRPATRAVADALPLLQQAGQVRTFTVVGDKPIKTSGSAEALSSHLQHHGVKCAHEEIQSAGKPIGDVLKAFIADRKIDLLVMGGYGHSKVREFILGGATRSVLTHPPAWVLMSH